MPISPIPEQGQLVEVRRRQYVVTEVAPGMLPPSPLALSEHLKTLNEPIV